MKIALGMLEKDGKILICKRKKNYMKNVTWDFPGWIVSQNESPRTSLKKNLLNELGISVKIKKHIVTHTPIENHKLTIFYYLIEYLHGLATPKYNVDEIRWVNVEDISKIFTHVLNNKVVIELEKFKD